jgi:medium-chain acyl-[acyl-carrier-protein] hydrolase
MHWRNPTCIVKEWIMDIDNNYQEDYRIRLNEAGPGGRLRLHALFDYIQDIASLHATTLGIGLPVLAERGLTWVLSRVAFRMDDYPLYGDTVRVCTYTRGFERLFALRQFELYSLQSGRRLGVASSKWLLLRSDKFRPVAPATAFPLLADIKEQRPIFFPELDKLPDCPTVGQPQEHRIGQFQIDWNMHVNNSYYAVYARDWLAAQLGHSVRLLDMQINFNAALLFGDTLRCLGEADGQQFRVDGVAADGRNVFQAAGHFEMDEDVAAGQMAHE